MTYTSVDQQKAISDFSQVELLFEMIESIIPESKNEKIEQGFYLLKDVFDAKYNNLKLMFSRSSIEKSFERD